MNNNIDINIANYENYVIDFLEGLLNPVERDCFIAFLVNNPDIKEEIGSVNEITLKADKRIFSEKDKLKKRPVITVVGINEDNYEEYFIAYYENDLTDDERKSLSQFLSKNPNLKQEFDIYGSLKLIPTGDVIFSDKNLLKRKPKLSPVWYSVAAALVILFTSCWFLFDQQPQSNEKFASVNQIIPKTISISLSLETIPQIETRIREIHIIPISENNYQKIESEEILLASVESKRIKQQFVDVFDFARIAEHKENIILATARPVDNIDQPKASINSTSDKSLLASIFNNQFKKIGSKLGFNKKKSKKFSDPTYVQVFDKGLTVFNTITGSKTSTIKTYNVYGELTSYRIEGREMFLSKNPSGKSSP